MRPHAAERATERNVNLLRVCEQRESTCRIVDEGRAGIINHMRRFKPTI